MQQMNTDLLAAMKREKRKTRLLVCCQLFCWPDKAWTVHSLLAATSCTGLGSSTSASHTQGQCLLQQDRFVTTQLRRFSVELRWKQWTPDLACWPISLVHWCSNLICPHAGSAVCLTGSQRKRKEWKLL